MEISTPKLVRADKVANLLEGLATGIERGRITTLQEAAGIARGLADLLILDGPERDELVAKLAPARPSLRTTNCGPRSNKKAAPDAKSSQPVINFHSSSLSFATCALSRPVKIVLRAS